MKICIDKVCEGVLCDEYCKELKPSICGKDRELFAPDNACGTIRIDGADDVEINQGVCIDLTEGVHAYDGNGQEIEYEVEPSEIGCCDVGVHEVTYTAIGSSKEMIPYFRTSKPMLGFNACGLVVKKVKRLVTILQALPPTIIGAVRTVLPIGASFDPMSGVSGVDDNGNPTEVTFEGRYDVGTEEDDIVTFESDVVQDLRSVKVSLEPIQNCTPWVGTEENNTPYLLRSVESIGMDVGNTQHDEIVGGTVAWNQLALLRQTEYTPSSLGVTYTPISQSTFRLHGTITAVNDIYLDSGSGSIPYVIGHKYITWVSGPASASEYFKFHYGTKYYQDILNKPYIFESSGSRNYDIETLQTGEVDFTFHWNKIDLTQMFGSTIADYIYSLETANAGAGVAWFKKLFPKPYYAYNAGELMSVKALRHITRGFNAWDEEWEVGAYNTTTGAKLVNSNSIRSTNYIPVLPNTTYFRQTPNSLLQFYYDKDKNYLGFGTWGRPGSNETFTTPANCYYLRFYVDPAYGTTYKNDICINISDPNRNGEYEPYISQSYPLDDSTEYRGLFKLDASNNLYADGDTYEANGNVTRRYATIVLDGDETWTKSTIGQNNYWTHLPSMKSYGGVIVSIGYPQTPTLSIFRDNFGYVYMDNNFCINIDPSICGSDATQFKTWLAQHPITVVYELTASTTETATPYESSQAIYEGGTEEYVDTRTVPIPVGHETSYALVCPIYGYDSVEVTRVGKNLFGGTALRDGLLGIPNATDHASNGYVSYWANTQAQHNITEGVTFKENTQYTLIYKMWRGSASGSSLRLYYKDGTYEYMPSPSENYGTEQIVYISEEGKTIDYLGYYRDNASVNIYYNESGIFEGVLTEDDFEPYQADTYTSPLPQTVYGGTLDVVSGVLTIDRAVRQLKDMPPNSWNKLSNTTAYYMYRPTALPNISYPFDSETAQKRGSSAYTYSSSGTQPNGTFRISDALYIVDSSFSTLGEWKTFASSSDIQFIYAIAEPITIQLTPQEVESLIGENNVWSEDGKVQVVYSTPLEDGISQFDFEGVYPIIYHTEDSCGNETEVTRYVIVGDNISLEDTYNIACQAKTCYSVIECDETNE